MTDTHDPSGDEQAPHLSFEPDGHLSIESLGDLDEGLLSDSDAAAARAHLAGCQRCHDDLAAVAAVRDDLAEAPEPTMPDDVAARLHEALAAAAPATGGAAVTTLPSAREPSRWERLRRPVLSGTAAAAAIALIAFGAVHLPKSSSSKASSAAGTSTVPTSAAPVFHTGTDYKPGLANEALGLLSPLTAGSPSTAGGTAAAATSAAAASAAAAPAASGGAGASAQTTFLTNSGGSSGSSAAAAAGASTATSGSAGGVPAASAPPSTAALNAGPTTVPTLGPLTATDAARQCLTSLAADAGRLLAIDYGRFGAAPAVIGVFELTGDSSKLEVVAAGPGCLIDEVAFTARP